MKMNNYTKLTMPRKDSWVLVIRSLTSVQTCRAVIRLNFRKLLTTSSLTSSKCSDKFVQV